MRVSKDLRILQALTDHLRGITPGNGYDFDLADSVFRGRNHFGDSDVLPAVSVLEAPRTEDPTALAGDLNQIRKEDWYLLVQGWVPDDKTNPTDSAYLLKASCEDRLSQLTAVDRQTGKPVFPTVYLLGRTVVAISIGPGIVSPPREQISNKAFFFLPLTVSRTYNPADVFVTI